MASSRSLGTLTLDLVARIGGYEQGLDKAEREAKKRAAAIDKVFDGMAKGVSAAFGLLSAGAVAAFAAINHSIEQVAKFQDLADETGASAEGLASLAIAGATAGVSMESIAAASIKLTKNLTGVDDESKAAGAALKALNIPIEEFKKLSPEEQIDALTKAFSGFADGTGKTAVALALWGKSGAEQLKLMKALEDQGGRINILTREQIKLADDYGDAQAKASAQLQAYFQVLSVSAIPAMTAVKGAITDLIKGFLNLDKSADDLATSRAILDWAEGAAIAIGTVTESIAGLLKLIPAIGGSFKAVYADLKFGVDLAGVSLSLLTPGGQAFSVAKENLRKSLEERNKTVEAANKGYVDLWTYNGTAATQAIRKSFDAQRKAMQPLDNEARRLAGRLAQPKPDLIFNGTPPKGGGGDKDDPAKRLLENQIKEMERDIAAQRDLMATRNKFLDMYNAQGLFSLEHYYSARNAILEEGTRKQVEQYDLEIEALKKRRAAVPKETDKADLDGRIAETEAKRAKLLQDAGIAGLELSIRRTQSEKEYKDVLEEVNAKILEMQGNLAGAAAIRFDAQNERLTRMFSAEGNKEGLRSLEILRQYTIAQADLTRLQQKFSLAQGDLQIAEERIQIARERGTMGEIESLRASGEARQRVYAILQQQIAAFDRLRQSQTLSDEQIQQYERLRVQLEQLGATLNPLADKFDSIFSDNAGNAFADFVTGAKSASQAIRDFSTSVTREITSLIAKDLSKSLFKSLFGDSSSGGGIGGFFASLFGGGGGSGGGFLSTIGSSIGKIFGGFFADGGTLGAGKWGIAGESGPELIKGPAEIVPAAQSYGRSMVVNQNISVPAGTSRQTAMQLGAEVSRRLTQASRRNN